MTRLLSHSLMPFCLVLSTGDAYRYTITPMFTNLKKKFNCNLNYKPPEVLYELYFYIEIPSLKFISKKITHTVYNTGRGYHSKGSYTAGFLRVEHDTGLDIQPEYIMSGRTDLHEIHASRSPTVNYTVAALKDESSKNKRIIVHEFSHDIFIISFQFKRPFAYSTSTWKHESGCKKDTSLFIGKDKHYDPDTQVPVDVISKTSHNTNVPYKYLLKSKKNRPTLKFEIPGDN